MKDLRTATIKEIVTEDFRSAAVFEKYSLDFCCRGGTTIDAACREKNIQVDAVMQDLSAILESGGKTPAGNVVNSPAALIDMIVNTHHAYVRRAIPVIHAHSQKVARVHGANHPEVVEIARHFAAVANEMMQHMMKEEHVLFPYIKKLVEAKLYGGKVMRPPFGTVANAIRMMEAEHESAGDAMYAIRSLSSEYTPPEDACTTFRVSYQELQEFELDLHTHVHLENNILFPAAMKLEEEILGRLPLAV